MTPTNSKPSGETWNAFAPLRDRTFRNIWSASLLSNFGQLVLGVGAAWEMTRLTPSPGMVALVQSALMLPMMLVAVPAGAIADMFDRRRTAMTGLGFASLAAAVLATVAMLGLTTPWILLIFCSLIGAGVALYAPAWQASIIEQVPAEHLPAAVALGAVSYNLARSFGPAIGGAVVLAVGAQGAFAINAVFYLPLLITFFFWKRAQPVNRLPPERLDRAIVSGARYALHSPPIRIVLIRAFLFGICSASTAALTPLIARDLLHGNAATFGLLLGATGIGAVIGALAVSEVRERFSAERAVSLCALVGAPAVVLLGFSTHLIFTAGLLLISGAVSMLLVSLFSIGVQLSAPRWVAARAISLHSSALTGGIALGAWLWGQVTAGWGVDVAMIASGVALLLTSLLGLVLPMPRVSLSGLETVEMGNEPEVALQLTARSGPIVIEIDYSVDPEQARQFYAAMLKLQHARLRNGAYDWSLSRDIANPALWTERYYCATWGDYLRQRERFTHSDRELQAQASAFNTADSASRVRRRLERPFGSVRWRADVPDPQRDTISVYAP
ncbi:MAG: transporter [Hydrocarboniphaga sp.]|uniref:MFS transporter n=1 Tax=Hydrocarboniphaga sp. TaxID=2033016 RepID=UPI00260D498E|nr:MFS transporter [Hydrocarboniphaga sp.]MDB5968708.1 transporter [Hydrocarboniphaga sp.]